MPHVVTQSCIGDGSCVYSCPVNCIQPTPDDPGFEHADMLHIDPATCMDCGACVAACPVDAIKSHLRLESEEREFAAINALYHRAASPRPILAPVRPRLVVRDRGEELRVAIVGSGPAAMYAAEEVLTIPAAHVTVYERLLHPYGLVRSGVAPDHRRTRRVSRHLDRIRADRRLTMRLGVEVGRDVTHDELFADHHAVIYGVGAASDRPLEVPGAELEGVVSATRLVGWYNGHPDHADLAPGLAGSRAVVIGNGNVALDVARMLTLDPDVLEDTEISPAALTALRRSAITEVIVAARRGPERSAFTLPELVGLTATPGVTVGVPSEDLGVVTDGDPKLEHLARLGEPPVSGRRVTLRYHLRPERLTGTQRVEAVEFACAAGGVERVTADLVVSATGYRGKPVAGLPFDEGTGTIPNVEGRVVDPATGAPVPGTYVVGWAKRGPSGFIGTNRRCSQDTVATLVDDYNEGMLSGSAVGALVRG
ncbi:4Fe-4S binding protein [Svornostia abyssi]|uniref:ferredoxin--NADP(+) reductase n=1 Tax=Svornostia abyssi TaxID=2898438 RepID=A0ABY5PKV9_9ACTN|nr:4Fe-4S binding protein [Parviterribacteraceae bacterium J379]